MDTLSLPLLFVNTLFCLAFDLFTAPFILSFSDPIFFYDICPFDGFRIFEMRVFCRLISLFGTVAITISITLRFLINCGKTVGECFFAISALV